MVSHEFSIYEYNVCVEYIARDYQCITTCKVFHNFTTLIRRPTVKQ